jgi:hypothetical protein
LPIFHLTDPGQAVTAFIYQHLADFIPPCGRKFLALIPGQPCIQHFERPVLETQRWSDCFRSVISRSVVAIPTGWFISLTNSERVTHTSTDAAAAGQAFGFKRTDLLSLEKPLIKRFVLRVQLLRNQIQDIHRQCFGLTPPIHLHGTLVPGQDVSIEILDGDGIIGITDHRCQPVQLLALLLAGNIDKGNNGPVDYVLQRPVWLDIDQVPYIVFGLRFNPFRD